jgi:hypothetical protein
MVAMTSINCTASPIALGFFEPPRIGHHEGHVDHRQETWRMVIPISMFAEVFAVVG